MCFENKLFKYQNMWNCFEITAHVRHRKRHNLNTRVTFQSYRQQDPLLNQALHYLWGYRLSTWKQRRILIVNCQSRNFTKQFLFSYRWLDHIGTVMCVSCMHTRRRIYWDHGLLNDSVNSSDHTASIFVCLCVRALWTGLVSCIFL